MNNIYIIGVVTLIIISAGAYLVNGRNPTRLSLDGTRYTLASHNGVAIPKGETYTVSFENGSVRAAFCNAISGSYTLSNGNIRSAMLVSTQIFCTAPADTMTLENAFRQMIVDGAKVSLAGDMLTLASKSATMVFTKSQ